MKQKAVTRTANNYSKGTHTMPDYDIYWEGSLGEEQVLWHFDEELINETVDDDCEIWGFSLLEDEEEAA